MSWRTVRWCSRLPYSRPSLPSLAVSTRSMTSTSLSFPSLPPLPARYRLRHVTPADRSACIRLITHAFMYHNAVDMVHREPSAVYAPIASMVFDHCMQEPHNLSFLLTDTQHSLTPHTPDTSHTFDHDADRDALADTDVAACILNYDNARWPPLDSLRTDPVYSKARVARDQHLFDKLVASDLRIPPPPSLTTLGHSVECFYLAVKCDHGGSGLARYLCRVLYEQARQLGYREMETSATHPATARIFLQQLGPEGVVTHRLRPSEVVVKKGDGSEERPWVDVKDDLVCVTVPIVHEADKQGQGPANTATLHS